MGKNYSSKDFVNDNTLSVPLELITNKEWADKVSSDEAIVYAFIKYRMRLSQMNAEQFEDENGLYTIYKQEEIAEQMNKPLRTVRYWFSKLKEHGLIETRKQGLGKPQKIYLRKIDSVLPVSASTGCQSDRQPVATPIPSTHCQSDRQPVATPYRENQDKRINTENKDTRESARTQNSTRRFVPPTLEEVQSYLDEKGYTWDAEAFMDFYISKGWYVGSNRMTDWKAACRNWNRHRKAENMGSKKTQEPIDYDKKWGIKSYGEDENYGKDFKGSVTSFDSDDLPF